jgi:hypothetical protein
MKYAIVLAFSDEDEGYIATVPVKCLIFKVNESAS